MKKHPVTSKLARRYVNPRASGRKGVRRQVRPVKVATLLGKFTWQGICTSGGTAMIDDPVGHREMLNGPPKG
jgi:hypothetical protein